MTERIRALLLPNFPPSAQPRAALWASLLLWRRSLRAYIDAFRWQSAVLTALFVLIGYFGRRSGAVLCGRRSFHPQGDHPAALPATGCKSAFGVEREIQPYVNVATSLILAGLLVLLAYAMTRPLVRSARCPRAAACRWRWG